MFERRILALSLGLLVTLGPPVTSFAQDDSSEANESGETDAPSSAEPRTGDAPDIASEEDGDADGTEDSNEDDSESAEDGEADDSSASDAPSADTATSDASDDGEPSGDTDDGGTDDATSGATDETDRDESSKDDRDEGDEDDEREDDETTERDDAEPRDDGTTSDESSSGARAEKDGEREAREDEEEDEKTETSDESAGSIAVQTDVTERDVYIEGNTGEEAPSWRLGIGGYVRAGYTSIQNDPDVEFVGRNDGFRLADARLSLNGELQNGIGFVFEFDGTDEREAEVDPNSPVVPLDMRLTDTFIYYQPFDFLRVAVGQFKPPFDVEEQFSNSELLFVQESVGSTGVDGVEGYNVDGLSRTRETGVRVDGAPWYPTADDGEAEGFGVSAAAAATNGQTANRNLNDNDRLAYYGRLGLHWGDYVRLGGAYFHNDGTTGERPDLVDVVESGWTADLTVDAAGLTLVGGLTRTSETLFAGTQDVEETLQSTAYHGQIAYEEPFIGLQPAYRYAYYDPTSSIDGDPQGAFYESDSRTHHTIGLNYNAQEYPVRVLVNYTIAVEEAQRSLENNRFDTIVQLAW